MKNKVSFFVLVGLFVMSLSYGQGGYLNKKYQVSFDVLSPFEYGDYGVSLLRTINDEFALSAGYKLNKRTATLKAYHEYGFWDYLFDGELRHDIGVSCISKGYSWEVNLLASGYGLGSGMQIPLGHYYGYGYERFQGSFTQDSGMVDDFEHRSNKAKAFWGKNMLIKHNFTIDIRLEFGFQWGRTLAEGTSSNYDEALVPFPFNRKMLNFNFQENSFLEDGQYIQTYFGFYLYPKLSIGYLF